MRLRASKLAPLQAALLLLLCVASSSEALSFSVTENVPNGTYVGTLFQNVRGLSGYVFHECAPYPRRCMPPLYFVSFVW